MNTLITDVDQATPDWLTTILHNKGYLSQGTVVTVQKESPYHSDISIVSRLTLGYSDDAPESAPSRLLLKIPKPDMPAAMGQKEVEFYNTVVNAMNHPPVVRCYDAVYSPEAGKYHLLLDDISATHFQPEWPLPPSNRHCEQVIDCIARFHAFWWDQPRLGDDVGQLCQKESFRGSLQGHENVWSGFVDFLGDRLSVDRRELYENVLSSWPKVWRRHRRERLTTKHGITLIHEDPHMWNALYPHDPDKDDVYLIDWDTWRVGIGTDDLAYMIALAWYPERGHRRGDNWLRRYHSNLLKYGITDYDWETCWSDYRVSAIYNLFAPVWWWSYKFWPGVWWPYLEKAVLAFEDLQCSELLEN